jgi:hypothetical protein
MYFAELIFPSTSVIVPTPSLQIHPKNVRHTGAPLRQRLIKIRLELEQHTIHSKDDLVRAATSIWYSISNVYISNLYRFLWDYHRHMRRYSYVTKVFHVYDVALSYAVQIC